MRIHCHRHGPIGIGILSFRGVYFIGSKLMIIYVTDMYVLIILCYIFVLYSCKSNSVELLINIFLLLSLHCDDIVYFVARFRIVIYVLAIPT